ncbi:hypothetical protein SCOCK_100215 [Actinacidiphila cocklensis]|uniref:Uncharacterized protein n=1 Tax=Actinacidiphila cocklensis TaxID=887465 RepID=A0A9W4DJ30_9ACTN|nr:hypothetical protein SCOCK_100215 [Actinacidiphila cocklensis]
MRQQFESFSDRCLTYERSIAPGEYLGDAQLTVLGNRPARGPARTGNWGPQVCGGVRFRRRRLLPRAW